MSDFGLKGPSIRPMSAFGKKALTVLETAEGRYGSPADIIKYRLGCFLNDGCRPEAVLQVARFGSAERSFNGENHVHGSAFAEGVRLRPTASPCMNSSGDTTKDVMGRQCAARRAL